MGRGKLLVIFASTLILRCNQFFKNRNENANSYKIGEYGYDLAFLKKYVTPIELVNGESRLIVIPQYQGRVMTSSSSGMKGFSHGWVNYDFITSGKINDDANPYGGEERIWLGPEGGQFSVFFTRDNPETWIVPAALDREAFNIVQLDSQSITLEKDIELANRMGIKFNAKITRTISLLGSAQIAANLGLGFGESIRVVAYKSENKLINTGNKNWDRQTGALSIWMLSMLKASPDVTMIIPYRQGGEGKLVNDYFGGIPESRLKVTDNAIFFKADGEFRSKIGITPVYALPCMGSYDAGNQMLTVLIYSFPEDPTEYVNSLLTEYQEDPFLGDVVNSYNDGPAKDGSRIGHLYEMETSSPAAFLKPGEEISHTQHIYHFEGNETELDFLTRSLLNISIADIKSAFKPYG